MNRRLKFVLTVAVIMGAAALTVSLAWRILFQPSMLNKTSKAALAQMHNALQIGDTEQRVEQVYGQFRTERTKIRTKSFGDTWEVVMPFEFGAGDWVLYVQFDGQRTISAIAMRTSDGIYARPRESPSDTGKFETPKGPSPKIIETRG
jgi:hypothetical protein